MEEHHNFSHRCASFGQARIALGCKFLNAGRRVAEKTHALLGLILNSGRYSCFVSEVTQLLERAEQGDPKAAEELLPLVYEELRKLAKVRMAREKPGHTLQPTALVHEAWLKIAGEANPHFANRRHFFKAAATAMRQILVDNARRKQRLKHGSGLAGEELHESRIAISAPPDELLAVNDALAALALEDPQGAEVVRMRYFVGMIVPEIADALNLAPRTVDRHWAFARAWLKRTIRAALSGPRGPASKI